MVAVRALLTRTRCSRVTVVLLRLVLLAGTAVHVNFSWVASVPGCEAPGLADIRQRMTGAAAAGSMGNPSDAASY